MQSENRAVKIKDKNITTCLHLPLFPAVLQPDRVVVVRCCFVSFVNFATLIASHKMCNL